MELIGTDTAQQNVSDVERWASLIGGGALMAYGLGKRSTNGWVLAALGGGLIYRGATGFCGMYKALGINTSDKQMGKNVSVPYELGIRVDRSVTINKPVEEVYRFWRNLENLPKFMNHLESVTVKDNYRSHWVAKAPAGTTVEWDAEIINEIENQLIGWRSLEGSDVDNAGSVHFDPAPNGQGTIVSVELQYNPPAGYLGGLVAKLFGEEPNSQITDDLRRLKQIMETGEIPTTKGQSSGRGIRQEAKSKKIFDRDAVTKNSEDSFPASDPPSWTPEAL